MSEAETLLMLYPRAAKLMRRGQKFIVIAEHEPYYLAAYEMIRDQEKKQDTWTAEDEQCYQEARSTVVEPVLKAMDEQEMGWAIATLAIRDEVGPALIQRACRCGYPRAMRIIATLQERGFLSQEENERHHFQVIRAE